jgi:hypothetical protein
VLVHEHHAALYSRRDAPSHEPVQEQCPSPIVEDAKAVQVRQEDVRVDHPNVRLDRAVVPMVEVRGQALDVDSRHGVCVGTHQ